METPNYNATYLETDDELYLDFSKHFAEHSFDGTVYLYLYQIVRPQLPRRVRPFLKVFLSRGEAAAQFPHINIPTELSNETPEVFLDRCIEQIAATVIQSHDVVATYKTKYKGFVPLGSEIVLVFENDVAPDFMPDQTQIVATIDEILNKKQILETPVEPIIRQMFYENPKLLYLTTEDGENIDIPQVVYSTQISPERDADGEMGFFYYFTAAQQKQPIYRFAAQMDEDFFMGGGTEDEKTDAIGIRLNDVLCYKNRAFFVEI